MTQVYIVVFFKCHLTHDVGNWLLELFKTVNAEATSESILRLDFKDNDKLFFLAVKTFQFCWSKRVAGKTVSVMEVIACVQVDISLLEGTKHENLIAKIEKFLCRVLEKKKEELK